MLIEIGEAARRAAGKRSIVLVGENEPQNTLLLKPIRDGGYGLDALWNDDYHHSAMVALDRPSGRILFRLPGNAARTAIKRQVSAICSKASGTAGRASAEAIPRWACRAHP